MQSAGPLRRTGRWDGVRRGHFRPPGCARLCGRQRFSSSRALPAPSRSRERQGRAAGQGGKTRRRGSAQPRPSVRTLAAPGSLSFWDGEQSQNLQSPSAPGKRLEGRTRCSAAAELALRPRGWAQGRRGQAAPGPRSCARSRRRLEIARSAGFHWVSPLGPAGLGWECRAPG